MHAAVSRKLWVCDEGNRINTRMTFFRFLARITHTRGGDTFVRGRDGITLANAIGTGFRYVYIGAARRASSSVALNEK